MQFKVYQYFNCIWQYLQMSELGQAMITFELGSAVTAADHYKIREVYADSDPYTPVIFIMPTELQGPAWDAASG